MADAAHKFTMTVAMGVLDSLGIRLYSNAAAVLSELVANAYDADAGTVDIQWQAREDGDGEPGAQQVIVSDDGVGMSVFEINARFLKTGYAKRSIKNEGAVSPKWGRSFMGRKGIGKLSIFSLADVVEVYTKKVDDEAVGLRIDVDDLQTAIDKNEPYHPEPIAVPEEYDRQGTALVLSSLKRNRAAVTAAALRKRLARRFDVLDETPLDQGGFRVAVNDKAVTWADKVELKKLQFIWEFGEQRIDAKVLPKDVQRFVIAEDTVKGHGGWKVRGWFGTTRMPTDLVADDEVGSLKNIIVLARRRPIQEGIIEKLDFSRIFGNYVTGAIEADFLDLDDYEDIATSDRQRLIEDDERVEGLNDVLRAAFVQAADTWSRERPKKEAPDALERYPKLKIWVSERPPWQRESALQMIGTIASLPLEKTSETEDRAALFRSGVLAFERIGLRKSADDLDQLSHVTADDLLPLLGRQDEYEAGLWVDILRSRVSAISQFRNLSHANEKEKVLQEHLFKHLWLIDVGWERATGSERMEQDLRRIEPSEFGLPRKKMEEKGRIDIRYATISGRHVIVELKRYSRSVDARDLSDQGTKYYNALRRVLEDQERYAEADAIEVVFVLGSKPTTKHMGRGSSEDDYFRDTFRHINGTFRLYDSLIANAENQYEQYLAASDKARDLDELLQMLDMEAGSND